VTLKAGLHSHTAGQRVSTLSNRLSFEAFLVTCYISTQVHTHTHSHD